MENLSAFRSDKQCAALDMVLKLNETGLASVLEFPQIVFTGDQSAGKSSVLEAISGLKYPRREGMCTRCAIEVVLREADKLSITARIIPHRESRRLYSELQNLTSFRETIEDISNLPDLIEKAMICMGLNDKSGKRGPRAFSRDLLRVEMNGPGVPELTLVDLPGLIHATKNEQDEEDVKATHALTKNYLKNRRTIVLAIISAKNDYANQVIINLCKQHGATSRTLGIITKPDYLLPNSELEAEFVSLSDNNDVRLGFGWHWLKNLESTSNFEERLGSEIDFFGKGIWTTRDSRTLGIDALRSRLSKLLESHLRQKLSELRSELGQKLSQTKKQLLGLGEFRKTISEKREQLFDTSWSLGGIIVAAVKGDYEADFFGQVDTSTDIDAQTNVVRLRAVIQYLNRKFTKHMRLHGHKYTIGRSNSINQEAINSPDPRLTEFLNLAFGGIEDVLEEDPEQDWDDVEDYDQLAKTLKPKNWNRLQAERWVLKILQRCKGRELPGSYNPELIRLLFSEQSEPWEKIASTHIDHVAKACHRFLLLALRHVTREDIRDRLYRSRIRHALNNEVAVARKELENILEDKNGPPMSYNHTFTLTVQRLRHRKYCSILKRMSRANTTFINVDDSEMTTIDPQVWAKHYVDPDKLRELAREAADMDRFSASEALDSQIAYYKDELKYFIDVVTKQVVERRLIKPLASIVKTSLSAEKLSDKEISDITAEPLDVSSQREELEHLVGILEQGDETFEQVELTLG
ncbi:MAG: hypothetical protein Q9157_005140 [Trypethelium eluteriae]